MTKNDYKLDFSYRYNDVKHTLRNCSLYYAMGANKSYGLVNAIYEDYREKDRISELANLIKQEDIKEPYAKEETRTAAIEVMKKGGLNKVDYIKEYPEEYSYYIPSAYRKAVEVAIGKTQEYMAAEASFQEWIKTRPGVRNCWVEYARKYNAKKGYTYIVEPTLKVLSDGFNVSGFRKLIEYNRPDKFSAGQVVRLKKEYINKRGKDPFYYKYNVERNAERIGTVLKKETAATMENYGEGSRHIRILWFMTGEESYIAEKCLTAE